MAYFLLSLCSIVQIPASITKLCMDTCDTKMLKIIFRSNKMFTKQSLTTFSLVWLLAFAAISGSANATTPDGTTPANEGVCDVLQGGTGGLYGLCVAYCEAQDLDTLDKQPPSLKILENYRKKMQAGDIDMPCVKVSCPCWSDAELASLTVAACSVTDTAILAIGAAPERHEALAESTIRGDRCSYVDLNLEPDTVNTQNVSPEQLAVCRADLEAICP